MNKYDIRQAIVDHADSIDSTYDLMTLRNSIRDITEEDLDDAEFRDRCRIDIQDAVNGCDDPRQLARPDKVNPLDSYPPTALRGGIFIA